jgi:hypothetical protein
MIALQKSVLFVAVLSNGAENGKMFGTKCVTALNDADAAAEQLQQDLPTRLFSFNNISCCIGNY